MNGRQLGADGVLFAAKSWGQWYFSTFSLPSFFAGKRQPPVVPIHMCDLHS